MTFMTHPEHGANNVSPSEVATHEKAGWKVTDRAEWMAAKNKPQKYSEAPKPFEGAQVFRNKPGPKPKGR